MVVVKRSMMMLAFVAAAFAGGFAGANVSAFGDPVPEPIPDPMQTGFTNFEIVGQDEISTFMVATVEPPLGGQILTVTFGPVAGEGAIVAMVPLMPGQNMFAVPRSMVAGVYTGEVCGVVRTPGQDEVGVN